MTSNHDIDLDPAARASLEFDAVLEDVAAEARTAAGRARVLGVAPTSDPRDAIERVAMAAEVAAYLVAHGKLVPGTQPDPRPALALLGIEDARPVARELRDLATVLAFGAELRRRVEAATAGDERLARVEALVAGIADLGSAASDVLRSIEPDGRIADGASPALGRIRREAARVGGRLRSLLEGVLRSPRTGAAVQDDFVTQRNGRFVVPVRADAHGTVRGIVHGSSSSGATLFVEPLESVGLNNDLVRLRERETEEEERILAGWSERFRSSIGDVRACVDRVSEIDALQACALWSARMEAVLPDLADRGPLVLEDVRHPLLDRRLRERGGACVPITVVLDPSDQVLVLSGPNTGGKTVALKSIGLAALLAQSGIAIPARRARLPVYRQIRADIGDHQSLDADLSTFSAHMEAVRGVLEGVREPALLLFDEIGTGTDPAEGAALAQAVLERLRRDGVTAAATTHHGALKSWAFGADRVVCAALEFDRETLRPTYRVLLGTAGVSAGLDVATRLGVDPGVIARARALLGDDAARAETYLERLRESLAEVERKARELASREAALDGRESDVASEIEREVGRARAEAQRRLDEVVEAFRDLGQRQVASIRDRRERDAARREHREADRRLAAEAVRRKRRLSEARVDDLRPPPETWRPAPGARVVVVSLDREGVVEAVRGDRAEVRLGKVGFQVATSDLRPTGDARVDPAAVTVSRATPENDLDGGTPRELHLLGRTADEAIDEIDRYLDRAVRAGWPEVRIVHGHGTGRLRTAVRAHLRAHPLATSHRPGGPGEGGDGATVVRLDGG